MRDDQVSNGKLNNNNKKSQNKNENFGLKKSETREPTNLLEWFRYARNKTPNKLMPYQTLVINSPYYQSINKFEAEKLLQNSQNLSYILRDLSDRNDIDFTLYGISYKKYGEIFHGSVISALPPSLNESERALLFQDETVDISKFLYGNLNCSDPSCNTYYLNLKYPIIRQNPFSLLSLSRAVINDNITFQDIQSLEIPKTLKSYLKEKSCFYKHTNTQFECIGIFPAII